MLEFYAHCAGLCECAQVRVCAWVRAWVRARGCVLAYVCVPVCVRVWAVRACDTLACLYSHSLHCGCAFCACPDVYTCMRESSVCLCLLLFAVEIPSFLLMPFSNFLFHL